MMSRANGRKIYFITGTDTGVGKTRITCDLIRAYQAQHISVMAYKPISCGAELTAEGLRHPDTLSLQHALVTHPPHEVINPWILQPPIAPHIAAQRAGIGLDVQEIATHCLQPSSAQVILVEGAGGWAVPVNAHATMATVAQAMQAEVILVVGMRLGCLNHALLTVHHIIHRSQLKLTGWVANQIDPHMQELAENIQTLQQLIPAPLLATVPYSVLARPIAWQVLP